MSYNLLGALSATSLSTAHSDLSDHELDVLVSEHDQALEGFNAAQSELNSLFDRYEAASNLETVSMALAARGDKATGAAYHFAGVATANALSCFGDDGDIGLFGESAGEEIDLVLAGEGFKEVVAKIWAAIKTGRDKLWRFLKKIASKVAGKVHRLSRSIKGLATRAQNAEGKNATEKTVELTSGIKSFMYEGKALKSYNEMKSPYAAICGLATYLSGPYWGDLDKLAGRLENSVSSLDTDNPTAGLSSMISTSNDQNQLILSNISKVIQPSNTKAPEKEERIVGTTESSFAVWSLLGDKIFVSSKETKGTDRSIVRRSEYIRSVRLGVFDYKTKASNVPDSLKLEVMNLTAVQEFCVQAQDVLASYMKQIDKGLRDKVRDKSDKLIKTTDKFVNEAKKVEGIQTSDIAVINAVPQHVGKFDSWITGPTMAVENQFVAITNAIASYASKSLSQYK